ncbi:hypothetical protein FRC06_009169, partial [Ceratobasidium sp. 370]
VHKDKHLLSSDRAEPRTKVYHQAISLILEAIKMLMQQGEYLRCADGQLYFFVAVIAVISAHYEEFFESIQSYPDLKHFPNSVTSIENLQGKERAIILKMLPPLIEYLLPAKHSKLLV